MMVMLMVHAIMLILQTRRAKGLQLVIAMGKNKASRGLQLVTAMTDA